MFGPQGVITGIVNTGTGNGFYQSGTRPLPEPMMTHIYVSTVSLGNNKLITLTFIINPLYFPPQVNPFGA